jgi:large subunit ribosomal protein L18
MGTKSKLETRKKRHRSLRKRMTGTPDRPRLVVFRSSKYIYVQVIDDLTSKTVVAASDLPPNGKKSADKKAALGDLSGKKAERAKKVGALVAKRCIEKGIKQVVFDRAGYKYHGRVSAVAAGAREAGLQF